MVPHLKTTQVHKTAQKQSPRLSYITGLWSKAKSTTRPPQKRKKALSALSHIGAKQDKAKSVRGELGRRRETVASRRPPPCTEARSPLSAIRPRPGRTEPTARLNTGRPQSGEEGARWARGARPRLRPHQVQTGHPRRRGQRPSLPPRLKGARRRVSIAPDRAAPRSPPREQGPSTPFPGEGADSAQIAPTAAYIPPPRPSLSAEPETEVLHMRLGPLGAPARPTPLPPSNPRAPPPGPGEGARARRRTCAVDPSGGSGRARAPTP